MKIVLVVIAVLCGLALIFGASFGKLDAEPVFAGVGIIAAALATVVP